MTTTTAPESTVTRHPVAHRVAVASLVLWGLVHLVGGGVMVAATGGSAEDAMATYATALTVAPLDGATAQAVTALVGFHGFNIAAAGVAVGLLAWRSRRRAPDRSRPRW